MVFLSFAEVDKETINIIITASFGLLGVLAGGLITFFSNVLSQRISFSRDKLSKLIDKVYLPLCESLESLKTRCEQYLSLPDSAISFDALYDCYSKCSLFLTAEKRLSLNKKSRSKLASFCSSFEDFTDNLATTVSNYISDLEKSIDEFVFGKEGKDYCSTLYSLVDDSSNAIKRMFIIGKFFSHIDNIESVIVVENENEEHPTWKTYKRHVVDNPHKDPEIDMDNNLASFFIAKSSAFKVNEQRIGKDVLSKSSIKQDYIAIINKCKKLLKVLYSQIDKAS